MTEWLPTVSGWTLGAIGVLLLAWALLGDWTARRLRGEKRRRCPKCWYDLSHSPGLRCSECGYEAKREAKLLKARRSWRVAAVAIIPLVGSQLANSIPSIQDRGWVAAVPTTALILIVPHLKPHYESSWPDRYLRRLPVNQSNFERVSSDLSSELFGHRIERDKEGVWATALIALTCHALPGGRGGRYRWLSPIDQLKGAINWQNDHWFVGTNWELDRWPDAEVDQSVELDLRTRDQWIRGAPLHVEVTCERDLVQHVEHRLEMHPLSSELLRFSHSFPTRGGPGMRIIRPIEWSDNLMVIADSPSTLEEIAYLVASQQVERNGPLGIYRVATLPVKTFRRPITLVDDIEDILTAIESPAIETILTCGASARLERTIDEPAMLTMSAPADRSLTMQGRPLTLALSMELRVGERVFGTGQAWFQVEDELPDLNEWAFHIELDPDADALLEDYEDTLSVRLVGDPFVALRNFDCDSYWRGEVTLPLTVAPMEAPLSPVLSFAR